MIPVVSQWIELQPKPVSRVVNVAHSTRLLSLLQISITSWFKQWIPCWFWPQVASRDFQPIRASLLVNTCKRGFLCLSTQNANAEFLEEGGKKPHIAFTLIWDSTYTCSSGHLLDCCHVWAVPVLTQELVISSLMAPNPLNHRESLHLPQSSEQVLEACLFWPVCMNSSNEKVLTLLESLLFILGLLVLQQHCLLCVLFCGLICVVYLLPKEFC